MTPQEIQALINAKIAGQGSAVDVGGALPQILSWILELAQPKIYELPPHIDDDVPIDEDTVEEIMIQTTVETQGHRRFSENSLVTIDMVRRDYMKDVCKVFVNMLRVTQNGDADPLDAIVLYNTDNDEYFLTELVI